MAGEEVVTLKIKTLTGEAYTVERTPLDTVQSVKEELATQMDTAVECLQLIMGRTRLKDNTKSLRDYGIQKDAFLRCVVKLMNYITVERMQGDWIWVEKGYRLECKVVGDQYYQQGLRFDFTITEEGFGFIQKNWQNETCGTFIAKPQSIRTDILTLENPQRGKMWWVRRIDEASLTEIHKEWPEWDLNDGNITHYRVDADIQRRYEEEQAEKKETEAAAAEAETATEEAEAEETEENQ